MIEELHIKNFKCFRELHLQDLGRINVVVGENGAGKTALLESVFLAQVGSPEVVLRLRKWRSLGPVISVAISQSGYDALWSNLFFEFDSKRTVSIESKGGSGNARSVRVFYGRTSASIAATKEAGLTTINSEMGAISPISFEYTHNSDGFPNPIVYKPTIQGESLQFGVAPIPSKSAFYAAAFSAVVPPSEIAEQFSDMKKQKQSGKFITQMKRLYPRIEDISVGVEGNIPLLYCDVRNMPEMVPIGLLSSGMHKLAAILLGIATHAGGVVLIDEIENGFYYKLLPDVWKAIHTFSESFNTQIFVSTHSKECLEGIGPLLERRSDDFRLLRIESHKGGSKAKMFSGKEFEAATIAEVEFR